MPQSVWIIYPAMKAWPIYMPPEPWQIIPQPNPWPDPPYPNYYWPGRPHASQPWTSKPIGAMPPMKTHMIDDLQRVPPFGVWKRNSIGPWDYIGPSSKHWMKQKMLGQGITFYMHNYTLGDDGTITRQVIKVKPKPNMQQWNQYLRDPRFRRHRLTKSSPLVFPRGRLSMSRVPGYCWRDLIDDLTSLSVISVRLDLGRLTFAILFKIRRIYKSEFQITLLKITSR